MFFQQNNANYGRSQQGNAGKGHRDVHTAAPLELRVVRFSADRVRLDVEKHAKSESSRRCVPDIFFERFIDHTVIQKPNDDGEAHTYGDEDK